MRLYADYPARRLLQIIADVLAVGAIALAIWLGTVVYGAIAVGAEFGRSVQSAGTGLHDAMSDAADTVSQTPLIGDGLAAPFHSIGGTGTVIRDLGVGAENAVLFAAQLTGIAIAVLLIVIVAWLWLPRRIRFVRQASEAWQLARLTDGPDLLALRSLVSLSRRDLSGVDSQPVAAWRRGDPGVIRALATLEMKDAGVRPPKARTRQA